MSDDGLEQIRAWWLDTATRDIDAMLPKMREYSASDLLVIGAGITPGLPDSLKVEAAIAFYASGKCARLTGALIEGREPHRDSWEDLGVYSFMGRFVREHGHWGLK